MRYFKIFKEQCKLSLMSASIFRVNFILMLVQSIINSLISIVCVDFIYGNVEIIAGWNKHEMIILVCTSLVVNQLFRAFINPNQMKFVQNVGSGAFDKMLLKPISIVFQINTGKIDISSLISLLAPLIIICMQINILGGRIGAFQIFMYMLLVVNGVIVLSSFMMLLYSLAFSFIKVDGLNNIYYMMMSISEKPREMFLSKVVQGGFIYIIPAIPLANAPAAILLNKGAYLSGSLSISAGIVFLTTSVIAIKAGMKKYSSASS